MKVFLTSRKVIIESGVESEKLIPLTEKQVEFYKANPKASYDEVWQLEHPVEPPKPIEHSLEDYKKWKTQDMSNMSLHLMNENGIKDYQVINELAINAETGEASKRLKAYNKTVVLLKEEYYRLEKAINEAESNADIDTICQGAEYAEIIAKNMRYE